MKKLIPHSTSKHGLNATKQASRGFGGSKKTFDSKQLSFLEQPPKGETEYPLKIESLPSALQWWDDEQFWLVHAESGLRVPGTWTKAEAELMQDLSKNWNWSVDSDRRVTCGVQLMALAESICKRSAGGEA
jgi:hypothetical protein